MYKELIDDIKWVGNKMKKEKKKLQKDPCIHASVWYAWTVDMHDFVCFCMVFLVQIPLF
jgi:hypothetical protein